VEVLRRPKFIDDLSDAYAYLAERNPHAADRLLDEVETLTTLLAGFPELGRVRDDLRAGVRSFRVRHSRYVLFYRVAENSLVLLRLLHGARDSSAEGATE
jgi:toxin ParE1/3/4